MKKLAILMAAVAMLVALSAPSALSVMRHQCTGMPCTGNSKANHLDERGGNGTPDYIKGHRGRDSLDAGRWTRDRDRLYGNRGNDTLIVLDGDTRDRAVGGSGRHDTCVVDARSEATGGCNSIRYGE